MSRGRWCLVVLGLLVPMLVISGSAAGGASSTHAAFTDAEHSVGTVAAGTLSRPTVAAVRCQSALLGGRIIEVDWSPVPPSSASEVEWTFGTPGGTTVAGVQPATTGPDAVGRYTSVFTTDLVDGLLGALFGGNYDVSVRARFAQWSSTPTAITYRGGLLAVIIGPTCAHT